MQREEWCRWFIGFSGVVYQVLSLGQVLISGQAGFAVRGQSPNPFMATLSSGAISSQQQSMLPPLPQQQSAPPPHPHQWSASPPLLQQCSPPSPPLPLQSAFLLPPWPIPPPCQQPRPLPLFFEAE